MRRLTALLTIAVLALGAGFVWLATRPAAPVLDDAAVRTIVSAMLAEDKAATPPAPAVAELDPSTLNPLIESYLLSDPHILERVNTKLQAAIRVEKRDAMKVVLTAQHAAIYDDPDHIVLGNPKGDVTLVEMFDYNCSFCRSSLPDIATLIDEDPNLRIILKEFPILTKDSVDAARIAVLVARQKDVDYWTFHQALFSTPGMVTGEAALAEAQKLGLDKMKIGLEAANKDVTDVIEKSYTLARALNVDATPTFILGDEVFQGAQDIDLFRRRIANMRACGSTECPATPAG